MEIMATNTYPDQHVPSIKLFAKDLVLLLAFHCAARISSLLCQVMDHPTEVLYDPETEVLFLPQFWLLPIYRELLNSASRIRPSRASELNRSASGLAKVLCKPCDSVAGGKGTQKGKLPKQGSSLEKFNEWFGSMSMMNTLYVWFPASWGPSVVEAIIKRNRTWLAKTPVQRDPAMFNATEVENGHAAREMFYKIQKWNVNSKSVYPILLANTRVDGLGLEDSELTQHFQVLREGILRDVFSQRASSAWQGAQPQKVTVSLLLPGSGTADQWLDFLQSQRHFWPSMTARHASLSPIDIHTFQRERRRMQSKHLWDCIDVNWPALSKKLYVSKPTGLNRAELWQLLFVTKHRANPWQEREYQGAYKQEVWEQWYQEQHNMEIYKALTRPFCIDVGVATQSFIIDNAAAFIKALEAAKTRHARRWQTKEGTYRVKEQLPPDVRDSGDVSMGDA